MAKDSKFTSQVDPKIKIWWWTLRSHPLTKITWFRKTSPLTI